MMMRIKSKFICFVCLLACMPLTLSISISSETDPFATIDIPMFDKAYHVKKFSDRSKKARSITYRVKIKYPAAVVIEFYDAYFNGSGWRPSYEICQRQWESFNDENIKGQPCVRQFVYSWEHPKFKVKAFLSLRYETYKKEWQDEVIVTCKIQPKVDISKLD